MNTLTLKTALNRRIHRTADRANPLENVPMTAQQSSPGMLQDSALEQLLGTLVTVYLISGIRLTGTLKQHDSFTLLLQGVDEVLVFKHAISTVVPGAPDLSVRRERRW